MRSYPVDPAVTGDFLLNVNSSVAEGCLSANT